MSNLSLETQSRVQCIKEKFENSLPERGLLKTTLSKNVHSGPIGRGTNSGIVLCPSPKTDASRTDGKAHVKRTPAFRREKATVKSLGKVYCSQNDERALDFIFNEKMWSGGDKEVKTAGKMEPLVDNNKFQNLQISKTDLVLNNSCDSENVNKTHCTKSTLISRRVNLLGENQNTPNNDLLSYAVVDKSQKKRAAGTSENDKKTIRETDLKLSESLRKALQSPLPKGPPPKKPPRTFCHVVSNGTTPNDATAGTVLQKDLPKLKSKLEKLENLIKSHEARNTNVSLPKQNLKINLEEKANKVPGKTKDCSTSSNSRSLPSALRNKNEKKICLQLTSCMNPCTEVVVDEKLFLKKSDSLSMNVNKSESSIKYPKITKDDVSNKSCFFDEAVVRRTMSEPIYDLPCVAAKNCADNKINKFHDERDTNGLSKNKPEEGLHYLCTDVVNKLNRLKPVEFSSADNWKQNLNARLGKSCENFRGNTQIKSKIDDLNEGEKEDFISGKGSPADDGKARDQSDGKSIKSDSDSWSMGSESERAWTPGSDNWTQENASETTRASVKKEILTRKTAQRKDYVSKVSSRLFDCVPYWMSLKGNNCSHLFECCLLVGLTLESDKNVPYIKNIYPPNVKPPPLIEALCFPDATNWPPNTGSEPEEQYYSLVVTNENGERKFGYCRRVLPEGGNLCLPLTYCIITPHRANGFFYKVLEELESRHGSIGMENFIKQLYESEFPGPGEVLKLNKILEEATKTSFTPKDNCIGSTVVRRPCDVRLEEKNLTQLFKHLHLSVFIKVFSSLLHERKVLLLSTSLRKLSSCIEALQSTLLPFSWQHTYIPVLPVHLLETCEAPTPYVIGLPKSKTVEHSLENIVFENGIMVDLDESKILKCCGDEGTILPHRLIKSLKTSLNLAINAMMLPEANRNVLISDAFIGFFVQVCGHYSKFITLSDGEKKVFEHKGFVKYVTSATSQSFLEWFTKTAMFQAFIHERLHGIVEDIPVKLFSLRAMENPAEALKNSTVLPLNYKVLNKKVKSFSDKIKDFIQ